jgi:hypothetical protein
MYGDKGPHRPNTSLPLPANANWEPTRTFALSNCGGLDRDARRPFGSADPPPDCANYLKTCMRP